MCSTKCLKFNPQSACAARVTVSSCPACMYVCVYVYVCVSTHTYRLSHWNHKREIPTDSAQYRDHFKFVPIFLKMLRSKVMGNMPTTSSSGVLAFFSPRNKLLCWFEAYSYVFTAQTTGL